MTRPGPARKPSHLAIVEGNPGHRTQDELAGGLKLKPEIPVEPDWAAIFVEQPVVVPRRRKAETPEETERREAAALERRLAVEDAKADRAQASEVWRRVVKVLDAHGLISSIDWLELEDLAVTAVRIRQCERDVSRYGRLLKGERGWQRNGSIVSAGQYRSHMRWLCGQFGLSPSARDFLPAGSGGGEGAGDGSEDFDV